MKAGYPAAFNNISFMLNNGQGLQRDPRKAADFALQTLNRVVACCAVPVAQRMLSDETKDNPLKAERAAGAILMWAAALGNKEAAAALSKAPPQNLPNGGRPLPPAKFTDLPPWMKN